jgi:predicted RNA-binding protein YlqC (UPF0109 family)
MKREVLLTETILKEMVSDKDSVSVKEFETTEEDVIQIEAMVSEVDMPKVIGTSGRTIAAIRTIVQACSSIDEGKKVRINIESY